MIGSRCREFMQASISTIRVDNSSKVRGRDPITFFMMDLADFMFASYKLPKWEAEKGMKFNFIFWLANVFSTKFQSILASRNIERHSASAPWNVVALSLHSWWGMPRRPTNRCNTPKNDWKDGLQLQDVRILKINKQSYIALNSWRSSSWCFFTAKGPA